MYYTFWKAGGGNKCLEISTAKNQVDEVLKEINSRFGLSFRELTTDGMCRLSVGNMNTLRGDRLGKLLLIEVGTSQVTPPISANGTRQGF